MQPRARSSDIHAGRRPPAGGGYGQGFAAKWDGRPGAYGSRTCHGVHTGGATNSASKRRPGQVPLDLRAPSGWAIGVPSGLPVGVYLVDGLIRDGVVCEGMSEAEHRGSGVRGVRGERREPVGGGE